MVYDGLLKALDPIKNVDAIAFADDLALIITIRKTQEIGDRVGGDWSRWSLIGVRRRVFGWQRRPKFLLTEKRVSKVFNFEKLIKKLFNIWG